MRYCDIINESTEDNEAVINKIKSSKWFKESDYDIFRGGSNKGEFKIVSVGTDKHREPVDMEVGIHNKLNDKLEDEVGYRLRNGMFCTQHRSVARQYGPKVYVVFPLDNSKCFYNPDVSDLYKTFRQNTHKDVNDVIADYSNGIQQLSPKTKTKSEIIIVGDVCLVLFYAAIKHGLTKNKKYSCLNISYFIDIAKSSDVKTLVYELEKVEDIQGWMSLKDALNILYVVLDSHSEISDVELSLIIGSLSRCTNSIPVDFAFNIDPSYVHILINKSTIPRFNIADIIRKLPDNILEKIDNPIIANMPTYEYDNDLLLKLNIVFNNISDKKKYMPFKDKLLSICESYYQSNGESFKGIENIVGVVTELFAVDDFYDLL